MKFSISKTNELVLEYKASDDAVAAKELEILKFGCYTHSLTQIWTIIIDSRSEQVFLQNIMMSE